MIKKLIFGIVINGLIVIFSYRKKSLTLDGSIVAFILANLILLTSGFASWMLLILFFLSSTLLTKYKYSEKKKLQKRFEKTGNRDMFQVIANGGPALIFSLAYFLSEKEVFLLGLTVALASCNADTWATEMGVLSKKNPISLRNFRQVPKGVSGAISIKGTFFAVLGSIFISAFAIFVFKFAKNFNRISSELLFAIIAFSGFIGSIIDSIMGAFLQGIYLSKNGEETEKRENADGTKNQLIRGFSFINNDFVNFSSSLLASLIFFLLFHQILNS